MSRWLKLSLSARLLTIFILTAIAILLLMTSLFFRGLGSQWQRAIAPHLIQYVGYLRNDLGSPPDRERAEMLAARLPVEIQVHRDGQLLFTTADEPIQVGDLDFFKPRRMNRHLLVDQRDSTTGAPAHQIAFNQDNRKPVLRLTQEGYVMFVELGAPHGRGRGLDELLFAIAGLAILLGLCYTGIRRLLAPIGRLQHTVQRISDGDLYARSRERGQDDLALLANSVDTMSESLQQMLEAKRELLLAISHELRSPLTRARVATELLDPSSNQLKLIKEIDEMEALIGQIVESERLNEHAVLNRQWLDGGELISKIRDSINAEIAWEPPPNGALIWADEARLEVLVRNLLNNAIQHGRHSKSVDPVVSAHLNLSGNSVQIAITDDGPGIDSEHINAVTDAFYRPDASRTRKTGGFGLGLYLCRRIAEAHSGTLSIESPVEGESGTRVTVSLPRN